MKKLFMSLLLSSTIITSVYGVPTKKEQFKAKMQTMLQKAKQHKSALTTIGGTVSLGYGIYLLKKGCDAAASIIPAVVFAIEKAKSDSSAVDLTNAKTFSPTYQKRTGLILSAIGTGVLLYKICTLTRELNKQQEANKQQKNGSLIN